MLFRHNYVVYGLETDERGVFYIGITYRPRYRNQQHIYEARNDCQCRKCRVIRKSGYQFYMTILYDGLTEQDAKRIEIELIAENKGTLTNLTSGGEGKQGYTVPDSTREKMSNTRRGRQFTDEHKANMRAHHKGNKGRVFSLLHRLHIGEARAKVYPGFYNVRTGEEVRDIRNLSEWARSRGLNVKSLHAVAVGREKSYHGWIRLEE